MNLLRIDASARKTDSVTRKLNDNVVARFQAAGQVNVVERDLAEALPQVSENWVAANFSAEDTRDAEQKAALALSDRLVAELQAADVILIGLPIYNFGVPAALKAWVDQVARAGVTFRYGDNGPVGLLEGKRAIITVASGGVSVGSDYDFATGYLRHVLGFIGITDVQIVAADKLAVDAEASLAAANDAIESLALVA